MTDAQQKSLERRPKCSTCIYFSMDLPSDVSGSCRKQSAKLPSIKKSIVDDDATRAVWPTVWYYEWCGSHQDFGRWYRNDFDKSDADIKAEGEIDG